MKRKTKFLLLRTSIVVAFVALAGRDWYLQVVMANYYRSQADTSKIRQEPVAALRGIVFDRNGQQLVWNAPSWEVSIVPHGIPASQAKRIYGQLSRLLHNDPRPGTIASMVRNAEWRPYSPTLIKEDVLPATAMIIKQLHTQLPGVRADPSSIRRYAEDPQYSLAHILGYTSVIDGPSYSNDSHLYPREHFQPTDQVGRTGIEAAIDPYLHGLNGTEKVEVDAGERPLRVLKDAVTVTGDNAYLTINWKLQQQVAADLQAALSKLNLRQGVAILEDPNTGQILSMVSLPSFNNNWFAHGISQARYKSLLNDPAQPLNDLSIAGQFPPGSTYKVITATAALQTHAVTPSTIVNDTGSIKLCDTCHIFYGWEPGGLGPVNIIGALARSSDIYFYTVAGGNPTIDPHMPHIGAPRLAVWARMLGLGVPTGIELPGEAEGLVPTPQWYMQQKWPIRNPGDTWHIGDTYNMAIGQGFNLATPLQMVNVAATIANGGTLYRPRIVERVMGRVVPRRGALARTQVIQPFVPSVVRTHFIDPTNLSLIQQGMHHSVDWPFPIGTSFNVTDKRIDAAGKTGTAEAPGGPHAWWIGYAPYHNPRVAIVVMVPNANAEGAYVAAPIAHKLLEDYFNLPPLKPNWLDDVLQELVPGGGGAQ